MDEQVLVVPSTLFYSLYPDGFPIQETRGLEELLKEAVFKPRQEVEKDSNWKQIIPYVLIRFWDFLVVYQRGQEGSEERLIGKTSIGIGGHINPPDSTDKKTIDKNIITEAAKREIFEEINVDSDGCFSVVGLLNDDSNEVGKVHLGVICILTLDTPNISKKENQVASPKFIHWKDLFNIKANMENWSQICQDRIEYLINASQEISAL